MADKPVWKKVAGWGLLGTVGVLFLCNLATSHDDNHPSPVPATPTISDNDLTSTPLNPVFSGHVLPFKIVEAVRNYAFKDGPQAQITVMVDGGEKADWAATGATIARTVMRDGVSSATVRVFRDNPWSDRSPTEYKSLAIVYVDPNLKNDASNSGFDVILANAMAPLNLVEYDELDNELGMSTSSSSPDAQKDKKYELDAEKARRYVIKKYKLSATWKPPEINPFGTTGDAVDGNKIAAVSIDDDGGLQRIQQCMASDAGTSMIKGCLADKDQPYILTADERRPKIDYRAPNLLMSDMEPSDPCQAFIKFSETHRNPSKNDSNDNTVFLATILLAAKIPSDLQPSQYEDVTLGVFMTCKNNPHMKIVDAARDAAGRLNIPFQE